MIGQQLTIPQLRRHLSQSRSAVGVAGEILVARALEAQGHRVSIAHDRGDLSVFLPDGQILGIEVKSARRNKQGKYQFTLWKHWQGRQCADHHNADVVILLCVLRTGDAVPFVVPVETLGTRHTVAITSFPTDYNGWLVTYRQTIRQLHLPETEIVSR